MQQPQPQPVNQGPLQGTATGTTVSNEPLSFRETVKKYYREGKRDFELHRARSHQEKATYEQIKAQANTVPNGDMPEYFVYGIGAQPTPMTVPGAEHVYYGGTQGQYPPQMIPKMVYPRVIPIEDIRVPLDERGMPVLRNLSIKYDPLSRTYKGSIVDKPEKCNVPRTKGHTLIGLPKIVQFHARDTLNRDVMLYSNSYCRACGFHQLRLSP